MSQTENESPRIWIVIPVYNQGKVYREVVEGALDMHPHVLVVDDGCDASIREELSHTDAVVVGHEVNRGKGAAILTGAREAAQRGATHIVTMDADGQHLPEDFPRFREAIQDNPHSLIIGRRDMSATEVPFSSRFGRAFGNVWARIQTGEDVGDVQSGYRAYPLPVLTELETWSRGFAFEVEVVTRAAWAGVDIDCIEVSVRYSQRIKEYSHFDGLRDNLRLGLLNTHLTVRSFLPWPHPKLNLAKKDVEGVTWKHPLQSLKTLLLHHVTPTEMALATALGVFLGTVPIIGFHTLAILLAAGYLGLNKPLAVAASQICMPPVMPAICIEVGYFIQHGAFLHDLNVQTLGYEAHLRLVDWLLGSFFVAPVMAAVMGVMVLVAAGSLRRRLNG